MCSLRNISYNVDLEIDQNKYPDALKVHVKANTNKSSSKINDSPEHLEKADTSSEHVPISGKPTGCIGMKKKPFKKMKKKVSNLRQSSKKPPSEPYKYLVPVRENSGKPFGCELLWQPEIVTLYIYLITNSSNPITLEAVTAAIHNLCGCKWNVRFYLIYIFLSEACGLVGKHMFKVIMEDTRTTSSGVFVFPLLFTLNLLMCNFTK